MGAKLGFAYVASGPLVRSSYKAGKNWQFSKLMYEFLFCVGEFFIKNILKERTKIDSIAINSWKK